MLFSKHVQTQLKCALLTFLSGEIRSAVKWIQESFWPLCLFLLFCAAGSQIMQGMLCFSLCFPEFLRSFDLLKHPILFFRINRLLFYYFSRGGQENPNDFWKSVPEVTLFKWNKPKPVGFKWNHRHCTERLSRTFTNENNEFHTCLDYRSLLEGFWTPTKRCHCDILTTAGEGTWMLGTERGRTWLARWHRTTPSVRAAPRSLGSDTFNRDSIFCGKWTRTQTFSAGFQAFQSAERFLRAEAFVLQLPVCSPGWLEQFSERHQDGSCTALGQSWTRSGSTWVQWWTVFFAQHIGINTTILQK